MRKLSFTLPFIYSLFFAIEILRNSALDLGINWFTITIYALNIIIIYLLHKLGKLAENWMEEYRQ